MGLFNFKAFLFIELQLFYSLNDFESLRELDAA